MIKFHGSGKSGRAAADYLEAEKDHAKRERANVEVLRGDPQLVAQVADSLDFKNRHTSGVIAWALEDNPTPEDIDKTLDSFEAFAWSGLESDRYAWSAVRHDEPDGKVHVHVFAARVDLETGKSLNIAPPGWQKDFITWCNAVNTEHGWARPDDPERKKYTQLPDHEEKINASRRKDGLADLDNPRVELTRLMELEIQDGKITDRADVITALQEYGEITRTGKNYNQAIQRKPDYAMAYTNRGLAKSDLGFNQEAIADHCHAISLQADFALAFANRALAKFRLGRIECAIADYDQAILIQPDFMEAYGNRGNAKLALEHFEEAMVDFDQAIMLQPNHAITYVNRGNANGFLDRVEEAIRDFDQAIRLDPGLAGAYVNRGNARRSVNQYEDAIADFNEAIRLNSSLAVAFSNRGNANAGIGRYEHAIADDSQAIRLQPDFGRAYFNRGVARAILGRFEKASEDLEHAMSLAEGVGDDQLKAWVVKAFRNPTLWNRRESEPLDKELQVEVGLLFMES